MKMKSNFFIVCFLFLSNLALTQIPNYVPTNGLVGWWPFNGNADDESGSGNDGTIVGAVFTEDRVGNENGSIIFDGIDDYVIVQDNLSLRPSQITISFWVYENDNNLSQFIYKGNIDDAYNEMYSINSNYMFGVKINSNSYPGIGWQLCGTPNNTENNQWDNIICTYDGEMMRLYVNCELVKTNQVFGDIDNFVGGDLLFGGSWYGNPIFFNGKMDDIGIWNRALTEDEIRKICDGHPEISNSTASNGHVIDDFNIHVDIFPNPVVDHVNIDFHDLNKFEGGKVKIMSMSGQIVYEENITQSKMTLSVADRFSKGIYIVTTTDSDGNILSNEKLIVQ